MAATIFYKFSGGTGSYTAELLSGTTAVVDSQIHINAGAYSFTGVTDGTYDIRIRDINNCLIQNLSIVVNCNITTTTTTTTLPPGTTTTTTTTSTTTTPPNPTIYYGVALGEPTGLDNPDISDSNINEIGTAPNDYVWTDGNNVAYRLWFSTADTLDWTQIGGYGSGSGGALLENVTFDILFDGSGTAPNSWTISEVYQISGITNDTWTTTPLLTGVTLSAGTKQAALVVGFLLPSVGDYFNMRIRVNNIAGSSFELVPLKSAPPTYDWGWDSVSVSSGDGRWRIKREV